MTCRSDGQRPTIVSSSRCAFTGISEVRMSQQLGSHAFCGFSPVLHIFINLEKILRRFHESRI